MAKKIIPNQNTKGFDKHPENINRTGANKKPISAILKELLNEKIVSFELHLTNDKGEVRIKKGELKSKQQFNEVVATMLLQKAIAGDLKAMEMIMDRTEGKAMQTIDLKGELITGTPITKADIDTIQQLKNDF